ncbi:alpha/beta hydrolase [Shimazuella sp. AN120528]|uniref:alpha/beta fold hydrolase n=1 Tax=Shimazuella soli TaxID=1892854 RepID=UPI001F0E4B7B|nr:alpha/beta hydrolase [Shimazuella soli]MCH5585491.1 alpha/beta hydrolase [Shimazuella soli]
MPEIEVNNTNLYYEVIGDGVPIIFIHPPLLSSSNFYYQQLELGEQFKIITFDIRGHGKSSSGDKILTYPLIIEDMMGLLDALQIEQAYIAGYSTGGSIALEAMHTYSNRFCGGILISAMVKPTSFYLKSIIQLAVFLSNKATLPILAKSICNSNSDCTSTYQMLYHEAIKGNPNRIQEYYRYSLSFDYSKKLSNIKQPSLLLYGGKDKNFQADKQLLQEKLSDHTLEMIENVTHQLPTKAAKTLNTSIANFIHHRA